MAGKRMDQLSTVSQLADSDLMMLYDISEGGPQKTKSILYSDFVATFSGGSGSSNRIEQGDTFIDITDTGTGSITSEVDGIEGFSLTQYLTKVGDSSGTHIVVNSASNTINFQTPAGGQMLNVTNGSSIRLGPSATTNVLCNLTSDEIVMEANNVTVMTLTEGMVDYGANTISGTGDIYCNDIYTASGTVYIGDTKLSSANGTLVVDDIYPLVVGDITGTTDLYYNNLIALKTTSDGIDVYDTTGDDAYIRFRSSAGALGAILETEGTEFIMQNFVNSAHVLLKGKNSSGTTKTLLLSDPDAGVELYWQGTTALKTVGAGVTVQDPSGDSPFLYLTDDNGATRAMIYVSSDKFYTRSTVDGGEYHIQAPTTGGVNKDLIVGDADGSVDLYYNGYKTLSTLVSGDVGGIELHATTPTQSTKLYHDTSDDLFYIDNQEEGGGFVLYGKKTGGAGAAMLLADPDGSTDLYYQGTKCLGTVADGATYQGIVVGGGVGGFALYDYPGFDAVFIDTDDADIYIDAKASDATNRTIHIRADKAGVITECITANGGGNVSLYHNGENTVKTNQYGLSLKDSSNQPSLEFENSTSTVGWIYGNASVMVFRSDIGPIEIDTTYTDSQYLEVTWKNAASVKRYFYTYEDSVFPAGNSVLSLGISGNVWKDIWATDTSINTSDSRMKTVISGSLGLDFIEQLNPVTYKWNDGTRPHQGLIAQEVYTTISGMGIDFAGYVDPYVVDFPDGWTPPASGTVGPEATQSEPMLALRYGEFIAPLIKSVQELKDIIDLQQATISGLEARIEALEA